MPDAPPIHFFAAPDGKRIAYALNGSGPLLICPAWWVSHLEEDWKRAPFRRFFERLGRSLTVVRYDRPGVGLSDRDRPVATLESEVAVLGALFDRLQAEQASMFAISSGGPLAVEFAARSPERVDRLAFYGSFGNGADVAEPEVQAAVRGLVEAHWGLGSEALANIFHPGSSGESLRNVSRLQRVSADAATASRLLQLTYEADVTSVLGSVACPSLVIHRKGDRAIPFEAGRRLATGLPRATLVALQGEIHLPWEGGDDVVPVLEAFLASGETVGMPSEEETLATCCHDHANRELVVDGEHRPLTPLEHRLLLYLEQHEDSVVTRDDALRDVWEQPFGGSNVVDAVVSTLRKKLGSAAIETVKGHGYRLRSGVVEQRVRHHGSDA